LTTTSRRTPDRANDEATSFTIAKSVVAEMLTVPANSACSCEQPIGTTGRRNSW
jgi:hypothetical protein